MKNQRIACVFVVCVIMVVSLKLTSAAEIAVPNGSFEGPAAPSVEPFTTPDVESWTKSGPISDFPQYGIFNQKLDTAVFLNQPQGSPFHIVGADGPQLATIGARAPSQLQSGDETIALYQQLAQTYQLGKQYGLTLGVAPASSLAGRDPLNYNPNDPNADTSVPPASLAFRLYFDQAGDRVTVSEGIVLATQLQQNVVLDFSILSPEVGASDAWLGAAIGIEIAPRVGVSGYWNLDNVRLVEVPEPGLSLFAGAMAFGLLRRCRRSSIA